MRVALKLSILAVAFAGTFALAPNIASAVLITDRWGANSTIDYSSTLMDGCVNKSYPTWTNGCTGEDLTLRSDGQSEGFDRRPLLYFEISTLSSETLVQSARLRLYLENGQSAAVDTWQPVYQIVDPDGLGLWAESTMTYNQRYSGKGWSNAGDITTSISSTPLDEAYLGNIGPYEGAWVEWDVTSAVKQWVKTPSSNQGFYFPSNFIGLFTIPSHTNSDSNVRPILEITYKGASNAIRPPQVTEVEATFRSGQTFITWKEIDVASEEVYYRIYRSAKRITPTNLAGATLIAEVDQNSSYYAREDHCEDAATTGCSPIGQTHFIIEEDGAPLSDTTGLFVYTNHESTAQNFYYAVTSVVEGNENRQDMCRNQAGPLQEVQQTPRPIRVWTSDTGNGWVYTQFMDYSKWNSAFEGYAYNFYVGVPDSYEDDEAAPLIMTMHALGGSYGSWMPDNGDGAANFDAVEVLPDDRTKTWWFGFANTVGHLDEPFEEGQVVNYTHQRLDAMLDFVQTEFLIDSNRVYAWGGSMGGSGVTNYALRRGDRFAAVYAESAMTDYVNAGLYDGATEWEEGAITELWGTVEQNLSTNLGMAIWEWYDIQDWVEQHPEVQLPFLADHHGMNDNVIDWESQGIPWYAAVEGGRHGLIGVFDSSDHNWPGWKADSSTFTIQELSFVKDESFLGFSNASNSNDPATTSKSTSGCRNCGLEWSSSWNDFDGVPVDTTDRYEVTVRTTDGTTATVDVTPRRLQRFNPLAGQTLKWENRNSGGTLVQSGTLTVDENGLFAISDVSVSSGGNTLSVVLP